jgi:peptidoglycan/LPS O-acetylase OafA/YrhL
MLAEAIFPFYLIHQTIIITVGYGLMGSGIGPLAGFLLLVSATMAGCWAFYLVGRDVRWLRPLIGLRAGPVHRIAPVAAPDPQPSVRPL